MRLSFCDRIFVIQFHVGKLSIRLGDMMLKVFLVEDEYVVREAIKNNIQWSDYGFQFCGEAGDGEVALSLIRKELPDIVITDIKMPFMDGLTLSKMIKQEFPWIEIILLTGYEEFSYAQEAIHIGVSRYLSKPISGEKLLQEVDCLGQKIQEKKEEQALMIALYITMDTFGTACNVTGDGAIALIIDRIRGNR